MKRKAKSAANAVSGEAQINPFSDYYAVRSNKMVEFDENASVAYTRRRSLHPGVISPIKSSPAGPALTRTKVHVLATPCSWERENNLPQGMTDPATPTMQIVESRHGCFEVIWDDIPKEPNIGDPKRILSSGYSMRNIPSAAQQSLERANAKLIDWFLRWNHLSDNYFKPMVVVFPDEDYNISEHDHTLEEDEALGGYAPPNSRVTSAISSALPSGQVSTATTREASREDFIPGTADEETLHQSDGNRVQSRQQYLGAPELHGRPGSRIGASRRMRRPKAARKLSNLEDQHFQDHRDSVLVTRSHFSSTEGNSPVLSTHHDSDSLAKPIKIADRSSDRNLSTVQQTSTDDASPEVVEPFKGNDSLVPEEPFKQQAATQAPEKNDTPFALHAPQADTQPHIHITE